MGLLARGVAEPGFQLVSLAFFYAPVLSFFDVFGFAPVLWMFGQKTSLAGGFPFLLAPDFRTIMLARMAARIRLEPLFATETFFWAMRGLHPAFSTVAFPIAALIGILSG